MSLRHKSKGRRARVGFTLVEVMIVVGVISIIASLAVPQLTPILHTIRHQDAALQVLDYVERARRLAYQSGRCHRLRLDGGAIQLHRRNHGDCVHQITNNDWTLIDVLSPPRPGVSFELASVPTTDVETGGDIKGVIVFRPSNRLRGDGDVDTADDVSRITVSFTNTLPERRDIRVTAVGRVCAVKHSTNLALTPATNTCP